MTVTTQLDNYSIVHTMYGLLVAEYAQRREDTINL